MNYSVCCTIDAIVEVPSAVLYGCSKVVVLHILIGLDNDVVALTDSKIQPVRRIRFDGDEVVGDNGEVMVI
jgi:hypothetical protein